MAFWSVAAMNLLDQKYFDYGAASTSTYGRYNAYPLPGRTFMARVGARF
jgi:iron complex outermembrane receptor protein